MRHRIAYRLLVPAPAAALLLATGTASAASPGPQSLTAPVGSTKGSVLLPYLEQENVVAREGARFLALQQESRWTAAEAGGRSVNVGWKPKTDS
jgi:hypothetical protein